MSTACTSVLEVNTHLRNLGGFETVIGCGIGGYKIQTDESLTKAARKRNKKRAAAKGGVLGDQEETGSGILSRTSVEKQSRGGRKLASQEYLTNNVSCSSSDQSISPDYQKGGEQLIKVASSNSYAAVVSGRNSRDLPKLGCLFTGLESDHFLPLVSSSTMSIWENSANTVSKRDVGIQVNLEAKSRSQGTMTTRKGQCKNKFTTAKICCNEDKLTPPTSVPPPVEFLGDDFTFQNALAKTVAQLGIKFIDWKDDESSQLFPEKD